MLKEINVLDILIPGKDIYLRQLIKKIDLNSEIKNLSHSDSNLVLNI